MCKEKKKIRTNTEVHSPKARRPLVLHVLFVYISDIHFGLNSEQNKNNKDQ